ncbi:hypothetical protein [Posidoniimonas polymericola]|uniref:hypothetical protein n=1 Tax=Posidoniimonas polymericola TaxID=2528002 RepID=UPI0011B3B34B|nr:hypothetical protein [Posidoniimonas polymericola]
MKSTQEITDFVDELIDHVLTAPFVYAASVNEIISMLLGLDAVRRFIREEKAPIRGYADRRKELGIPVSQSLEDYLSKKLKDQGNSDPTEREILLEACRFWRAEIHGQRLN